MTTQNTNQNRFADYKADTLASANVDSLTAKRFERHMRLTQRLLNVPKATISLIEDGALTALTSVTDEALDNEAMRFCATCPLEALNGKRLGTLSIMDKKPRALKSSDLKTLKDIAALISSEISALQLATTDELTGLANRRAFNMIANHSLRMCSRDKRSATLLMIDLDGFKRINDIQGHAAGDRTLVQFAQLLKDSFRESDVIARLGGDEFGVLLADTDVDSAWMCVERFRGTVNQRRKNFIQVAFSVGVIQWDQRRHDGVTELLEEADTLMYARKRAKQLPRKVFTQDPKAPRDSSAVAKMGLDCRLENENETTAFIHRKSDRKPKSQQWTQVSHALKATPLNSFVRI